MIQDLEKAAYNLELLQEKIEESDYDYFGGEGYGMLNLKKVGDKLLKLADLLEEFFKNSSACWRRSLRVSCVIISLLYLFDLVFTKDGV